MVFTQPSGAPHPAGHTAGAAGPVPLAPSLTSGWNSSFPYPPTDSPQPWVHPATPKQTYEQSYASTATSLHSFTTFGSEPRYPAPPPPPLTSTDSRAFSTPLGWNAQTGPVRPFDSGPLLSRSLSGSYDELSARLSQNTNPYRQPLSSQPYPGVERTEPPPLDHPSHLRSDSYPSEAHEIEYSLSAKNEQVRKVVPTSASRQWSFSSDDRHKFSPLSAPVSQPVFTFAEPFDPEREYRVKHIKQEVPFPGRRQLPSKLQITFTSLRG